MHRLNDSDSDDSEENVIDVPVKKNRRNRVSLSEEQELQLFDWLKVHPELYSKQKKYINFPKVDKVLLWREVAVGYDLTG